MKNKYKYSSILGWSVSRYETFQKCKRCYFYTYYGKHCKDVSYEEILYLKRMTSIPLEIGNIVHKIIATILERYRITSQPIDKTRFITYIYSLTKKMISYKIFKEVFYKEIDSLNEDNIFLEIKKRVNLFLESNRFDWIIDNLNYSDKWIIEPDDFGETRLNNLKAYCKVDFFLPVNNEYYILDWKTGKESAEKHTKQMLTYSLWAINDEEILLDKLVPILAYINDDYYEQVQKFTGNDIENIKEQISLETEEMYKYCSDIEKNIPLSIENFSKTENKFLCYYCNFKKLCGLSNL